MANANWRAYRLLPLGIGADATTTKQPCLYLRVRQHILMGTSICLTLEVTNRVVCFPENPLKKKQKQDHKAGEPQHRQYLHSIP